MARKRGNVLLVSAVQCMCGGQIFILIPVADFRSVRVTAAAIIGVTETGFTERWH